ncbi:MAG: protein kinase, partial [Scytonema sp. PMC 1069.18]|nr:protein kinase [Scytonema sp. PMC 1069.18]
MVVGHVLRNRYKIVRLLGGGSFGVTYLAEDLDLPGYPRCVVKNLKKQYQNPKDLEVASRLFDIEAKVLYHLGNECKQIPRLFAHFEENGEFYLVQEFIDGHDLGQEILPGKKWTEAEVVQLLREILEVLAFVHNQNIIHRDIKAQNLMRRHADGKIVLIDFGAVKQINVLGANSHGQTIASVIIGTSGYMPTEQMNGYPKLSSDVYAVGMLGIYALTGIRPQNLPRNSKTFEVIWRDKASVSSKLADVLDKMVHYNFNERYQTATEALQALTPPAPSTLISPSSLRSLSLPTQIVQKLGNLQKILISAAVGVGVLLGVGMLFMIFWRQPTTDIEQNKSESTRVPSNSEPAISESPNLSELPPNQENLEINPEQPCPETSVPPLPNRLPDWVDKNNNRYFDLPKNQSTGRGFVAFSNQYYYGELIQGRFVGCGILQFNSGTRYIGRFDSRNQFYGRGKIIFNDGQQYEGEFKEGKFHGQGTFFFK